MDDVPSFSLSLSSALQPLVFIASNMGNEVSRARMLTVGSFLVNFGVQTYGMISTPNMKDVAEAVRRPAYSCRTYESSCMRAYIEPFRLLA